MKQYFSIDSSIFTFFAIFFIIIGSPIWLMIFSVITIAALILNGNKQVKYKPTKNKNNIGMLIILTFFLIWATSGLGFFGFGIVLFGYWIYFLVKYIDKPVINVINGKSDGRRIFDMLIYGVIYAILLLSFLSLCLFILLFFLR